MTGQATYNTNSFNTYAPGTRSGIFVTDIDHVSIPEKTMAIYPLADSNGNVPSRPLYPFKRIKIEGGIAGTSQSNLDSRIDDFKAFFNEENADLDITYNGTIRRYTASIEGVPIVRRQKGLYATFTVIFICQPFGSDTSSTSLFSVSNHTDSVYNATPTVLGSAPVQQPIFTITLDALTGAGDYIQLSNDLNSQTMLIYGHGLQAGDVIVIDSVSKTVTINDEEIDYYGTFIQLKPGASSITYVDGFDTRTVDISAEYFKQYQ